MARPRMPSSSGKCRSDWPVERVSLIFSPPCCPRLEDHTEQRARAPCISRGADCKDLPQNAPSAAAMFVDRLKFKISAGHTDTQHSKQSQSWSRSCACHTSGRKVSIHNEAPARVLYGLEGNVSQIKGAASGLRSAWLGSTRGWE